MDHPAPHVGHRDGSRLPGRRVVLLPRGSVEVLDEVVGGLFAATVFTTFLGVAPSFIGTGSTTPVYFWAWAFLYFVAPPFLVLFLANRSGPRERGDGPRMPLWLSRSLGALGLAQLVGALVWFIGPDSFASRAPWAVTPLTSRTVASFVALHGRPAGLGTGRRALPGHAGRHRGGDDRAPQHGSAS